MTECRASCNRPLAAPAPDQVCHLAQVALSIVLWVAGAVLVIAHVRAMTRANPDEPLPWTGSAPGWTLPSAVFYGLGIACTLLASTSARYQLGTPTSYDIGLMCLLAPLIIIRGLHNRRVRQTPTD